MPERIRDLEAKLAMAQRHVAQGRRIVARQYERIDRLRCDRRPTAMAEDTLALFLMTLKAFEDHERELLNRADEIVKRCLWIDSAVDLEWSGPEETSLREIAETMADFDRLSPPRPSQEHASPHPRSL